MLNCLLLGSLPWSARVGIVLAAVLATAPAGADTERWYTPALVQRGATVFAQNCAECHGAGAEGTGDWRKANADGKYPPPPLNGSAHAWHHPLDMLRRVVRTGGAPVGGQMPPFEDKLSPADMDAAIAYFQAKWPANIYSEWLQRNGKAADSLRPVVDAASSNPVTIKLSKLLPKTQIGMPEPTPLAGMYQVRLGNRYVYVTADGRYAFLGDLVDLDNGRNLSETRRNGDHRALVDAFPPRDMVEYPAVGEQRAAIAVFTDTSCPYCRQLHQQIPDLQAAGVAVRYIAFPRAGLQGEAYRTLRAVWCADDRRLAMDAAIGSNTVEPASGNCAAAAAVDAGYRLGQRLGITGTPAIVLPRGDIHPGYLSAGQLLTRLGL